MSGKLKKNHFHAKGRTPEQVEQLKRVFGNGMEVVDATADLVINAKDEDKVGAVRYNPLNCVFSRSCHRLFDSTAVVFFSRTIYLDFEDEDGVRRVHRYIAGRRIEKAIDEYDENESFDSGTYLLRAPSKSSRLDEQRSYAKKRMANPVHRKKKNDLQKRRRALIKSKAHKVKTKDNAVARAIHGVIRNGSGLVYTRVLRD
jgi:hypothetical protein